MTLLLAAMDPWRRHAIWLAATPVMAVVSLVLACLLIRRTTDDMTVLDVLAAAFLLAGLYAAIGWLLLALGAIFGHPIP